MLDLPSLLLLLQSCEICGVLSKLLFSDLFFLFFYSKFASLSCLCKPFYSACKTELCRSTLSQKNQHLCLQFCRLSLILWSHFMSTHVCPPPSTHLLMTIIFLYSRMTSYHSQPPSLKAALRLLIGGHATPSPYPSLQYTPLLLHVTQHTPHASQPIVRPRPVPTHHSHQTIQVVDSRLIISLVSRSKDFIILIC